jgi:ATP-dependent protease ClpP protease subunit
VVYLAGRERVCAPSGTFLFHGVTSQFPRGAALSLPQLQERLSALVQDEKRVAALICQHTQLQEAEVRDFFHQGEVKDASFALAKGICHRLGTPQLPAGLPLHTIGPSRPTLRRPSH